MTQRLQAGRSGLAQESCGPGGEAVRGLHKYQRNSAELFAMEGWCRRPLASHSPGISQSASITGPSLSS